MIYVLSRNNWNFLYNLNSIIWNLYLSCSSICFCFSKNTCFHSFKNKKKHSTKIIGIQRSNAYYMKIKGIPRCKHRDSRDKQRLWCFSLSCVILLVVKLLLGIVLEWWHKTRRTSTCGKIIIAMVEIRNQVVDGIF